MQSVALTAITLNTAQGIREVGKGSWKVLSWKVQNEIGKIEVGKFEPKLESTTEIGSCKVTYVVGKFKLNLEILNEVGKPLLN